ncbi:PREDICTED: protein ABHD15-like [Branchiostoma belcheri]|uniref:Protein ABHD15-like n=1 Tax=Branchiostoma belcheri TaxID=7741 RepID=A0A6P4YCW3_BRABE|nr:PREDICTED: protein ABHD15-like [Branchiostoma belcheri]
MDPADSNTTGNGSDEGGNFLTFLILKVGLFFLILYVLWLYVDSNYDLGPRLVSKNSSLRPYFLQKCLGLRSPFVPTAWALNPHVQTALSAVVCPATGPRFEREFLELKDGGVVGLDWTTFEEKTSNDHRSIVIVVCGAVTTGNAVARLCQRAWRRGFRAVVFRPRGHGDVPLTTPRLQSFGDPSDFREALEYIRATNPGSDLTAVSLSTGCGVLISYLGEYGSSTYLTAAACISPIYCAENFYSSQAISSLYRWILLQRQKLLLLSHVSCLQKCDTLDGTSALRTGSMAEFEEMVFCKTNGVRTMEDYWEQNEPTREIDEVAVPLLCISSKDDPLVPKESIPIELFLTYPHFFLALTEKGGHCGFFEGFQPESRAEILAFEFLRAAQRLNMTTHSNGNGMLV